MGQLVSSADTTHNKMKSFVLSLCVAAASAGVLVSNAPAHHFQAATAPADHFLAATAPADHFSAQKRSAPVEQFPAAAHAAAYTTPNLAPYASYYTVKGAALGGVPAPIPGAAL